jgi:hypothetical protein
MVGIVTVITLIFTYGLTKLEFETSLNYLMPKDEHVYKLGQRANAAFLDSETFVVSSVEPVSGKSLFSNEVFSGIVKMVREINEYRNFDYDRENARLETLIQLGNIRISENKKETGKIEKSGNADEDNIDFEIDKLLEEESFDSSEIEKFMENESVVKTDLWDMSAPLSHQRFDQPSRARNNYDYSQFQNILYENLVENIDEDGLAQLETICLKTDIKCQKGTKLARGDFKKILEAWEDIYLFKSMEIIQIFINPMDGKDVSGRNNKIQNIDFLKKDKTGDFIIPANQEEFNQYKKRIKLNPLHRNLLYSENQSGEIQAFGINIVLKNQENYNKFSEYLMPMLLKYNRSPLEVHSMGSIVLEKYMVDYMKNDLLKFMPLVLLVIIFTFYFNFRTLTGVLLPSLTVVIGSIWTMGLMGLLGVKISLAVSILPPLLIAIGSSYAIHLLNQYMVDKLELSLPDSNILLIKSMMHIWLTVFLAAFTTIISFMTLSVNQVISLKHFGIFAASGAFFSMIVGMILIPAGLTLIRPVQRILDQNKKQNVVITSLIGFLSGLTFRHYKKLVVLFIVLFIAGIFGIIKIKTETAPVESFKENSPLRLADAALTRLFSGTINLTLIIDSGKPGGVLDPEFLNWVESFRDWLALPENKENYSILSNFAFSDLVKRLQMALHSDDPKYFTLPQDKQTLQQFMVLFSGEDRNLDGRADILEQFVDKEFRRLNVIIRTGSYKERTISSGNDRKIINAVNKYLETVNNPEGYKWFFVGTGINMLILSDYIVQGQIWSIFISITVMMFIIFFIFKKIKISFLAMIPLGGGICFTYGIMGYLGIPLDIPRAILSSIAIGIGIDDTIHFLKTVAYHKSLGKSIEDAIRSTYQEAGFAIIYTAIALISGFSVLTLSSFTPIFSLGLLVDSVMFATTIGALVFLPAFILFLGVEINESDDEIKVKK